VTAAAESGGGARQAPRGGGGGGGGAGGGPSGRRCLPPPPAARRPPRAAPPHLISPPRVFALAPARLHDRTPAQPLTPHNSHDCTDRRGGGRPPSRAAPPGSCPMVKPHSARAPPCGVTRRQGRLKVGGGACDGAAAAQGRVLRARRTLAERRRRAANRANHRGPGRPRAGLGGIGRTSGALRGTGRGAGGRWRAGPGTPTPRLSPPTPAFRGAAGRLGTFFQTHRESNNRHTHTQTHTFRPPLTRPQPRRSARRRTPPGPPQKQGGFGSCVPGARRGRLARPRQAGEVGSPRQQAAQRARGAPRAGAAAGSGLA
jgi:hypothetical protein